MDNKLTLKDFPGGSDGKVSVYNVEDLGSIPRLMRETWIRSLGWEDSLEKEMATTPVLLPRNSHGQRSLVGYSPWSCKESDTTEQLHLVQPL